jgi:type IV secretory pathway ATPase VirB11/archaellum biosynthesis ATPase/intein/homing endonuclease
LKLPFGRRKKAGEAVPEKTNQLQDGAMRVGDLQLSESAETKPFVDVVQLEGYPLNIYAAVTKEEGREGYTYVVIEPTLSDVEKVRLADLKKLLVDELDVDLRSIDTPEKAERYVSTKVKELAKKYGYKIPPPTMTKLLYYLTRDYIHLGKIEPLMRDKLIEDISCDGAGIPIYIWYRDYESIPTNIMFETDAELDTYVSKLAYSAGKHVSLAEPIVDASLADGSRLHLTYGKEITQKGSTFTIRKFRVDPLTIVDLIRYNTLSSDIAAYLWYLIEKKLALLIAGGTASGKSIPHDEKVLLYRDGAQALVQIGELFDEMASVQSTTNDGVYESVKCANLQTAAFGPNLKVERFSVKSVVRHPAPDKIYALRTRSGRTVRATGDHSIFTIIGGRVTPFPTEKVTPGMFVAVPRSVPDSVSPSRVINLLEILAKGRSPVYVENVAAHVGSAVGRLGERKVSRILGIRLRSVREGVNGGFLAVKVDKFLDLVAAASIPVKTESLWIRSKTNRKFRLRAELPMTKALARFLGFWTAEGMYQEKGVSLFQPDPRTRTLMLESASVAFGLSGRANKGDRTRMDFNSSVLLAVLKGIFGEGSGAGSKRIPEVIFGESNEFIAEFLRGYFTGDASAGPVIEASTKSRELAHQLLYALSRFAIVARLSPKVVKGRTYYRVSIFGQPNLRRFEETVGFLDKARQSKLRDAVLARLQPHTNVDTIPGIAPLLKEALLFKHGKEKKDVWSDWHSYWSPTRPKSIGRETLLSYVRETGARDTVEQRLSDLAYSDIFWDEVVEVETLDYRGKYVFDLEVPGAQNFVGGSGGVFLHNTTTLNALSMFIEPGEKIVSVEDTPELNLPHENWIQSVTRGVGTAGEITMFDLLKASLRQRPDVLIVGEVRGEEAFTLLQSIATGHGGLGTIHADSVEATINRLTTEPMNIPRSLVGTTLDCIVMQLKMRLADKSVRRVVAVTEVVGHDARTDEIVLNDAFKWDPVVDKFAYTGRSKLFDKITVKYGTRPEEIRREIDGRKVFLDWLVAKNIRGHAEVSNQVREFYAGPYAVINKAKVELEGLKV